METNKRSCDHQNTKAIASRSYVSDKDFDGCGNNLSLLTASLNTNTAASIMSAPCIPNLNTLRKGARGGARGGLSSRSSQSDKDAVIRSTDGDASSSRISAVEAGYLDDPFAKHLSDENWQRRLPLMNRGETLHSPTQINY